MTQILDYLILCGILIWLGLTVLALREVFASKSRIARVHPLGYLWRHGAWWTRTQTLLLLFAALFALGLLRAWIAS